MRLTDQEIQVFREVILKLDPSAEIYLCGSRVHDHLKGGDIDILVFTDKLGFSDKITLLAEIKQKIGDQKIDLLLKTHVSGLTDPFVKKLLKDAKKINYTQRLK